LSSSFDRGGELGVLEKKTIKVEEFTGTSNVNNPLHKKNVETFPTDRPKSNFIAYLQGKFLRFFCVEDYLR
jgi:hypothetical protein